MGDHFNRGGEMAAIAFALPIVPGKEQMDRDAFEEMKGSRREEAEDVGAAMQAIATSEAPFDRWFRETMEQVHGIDLADAGPPPQLILDASF
jgi:hypothetical protein